MSHLFVYVGSTSGVKIATTPCHNCADQLLEMDKKYKLGMEIKKVGEVVHGVMIV